MDRDWVHDRFDDDEEAGRPHHRETHPVRITRRDPYASPQIGSKLKVENIHYDLTEDDIRELFERIGPVTSVSLVYDKQDRSRGIAFVVLPDARYARAAIEEFDGANANGQPIRISLVSNLPEARRTAERQPPSILERIAANERRNRVGADSDDDNPRRSNVQRAAPDNIDRYVPGQNGGAPRNDSRRRSPRRNDRGTRRPGQRRQPAPRERSDTEGHALVGGRPRKTAEELDAEMADYWGGGGEGATEGAATTAEADVNMDDEI
ncbi:RNA-binding domain-containing protein [Microthyrium microscopicum]|uniref:RNA-binding domain-containing protein n=1 Tax=Microthyrium microscopicum TaxID=703497 RepID=A0A6A6TW94_9PEZI|nr:RNA-binding domain-containing protein [Microthyrium microscopicum]